MTDLEPNLASLSGYGKTTARLQDYIRIARPDHVTKHIFIVPGIVLAYLLRGVHSPSLARTVLAGIVTAVCIAAANYVINEYLDREFDQHHPTKSARSSVQAEMDPRIVWGEWLLLIVIGLAAAYSVSQTMLLIALMFGAQGLVYNVQPMRTKDVPFVDVISEAVNNPFRLMIGWAMIDPVTLPPSSLILAYWSGGAFLMASKRLSEYREIVANYSKELLVRYRKSFAGYTEVSLTSSCLLYALISISTLSIFLVKYRIEYVLVLPFIAILFSNYMSLSMLPKSTAQAPEKLFQERGLMGIVLVVVVLFVLTTIVDLPVLDTLTRQEFISFG